MRFVFSRLEVSVSPFCALLSPSFLPSFLPPYLPPSLPSFLPSFLSFFSWLRHVTCRISVPWSAIEPGPWQWKCWVLTTRPPGNSLSPIFLYLFSDSLGTLHFSLFYRLSILLKPFLYSRFFFFFLAALGLCCCARAFSSCGERGLLFVAVCGLLIAVASLVAEHGL